MYSRTLAVLMYGAAAMAQAMGTSPPQPAMPDVPVPAAKYESAFAGYRPFHEEKIASWRELNDEVGKVGGHIGMFRGAAHGGHGSAKPGPLKPAAPETVPKKELPTNSFPAPSAPQGGHQGH